jgi:hypothetical protein
MEKLKKIIITIIKFPEIPKLNGVNLKDLPFDVKNEITAKTYIRLFISAILGALIAYPFFTNGLFGRGILIGLAFMGIYFYGWIYSSV